MSDESPGEQPRFAELYSANRRMSRLGPRQLTEGAERRRSERVTVRALYAMCRETRIQIEELRAGQVMDLSAEGLSITLSRPFPIDTVLGIELQDSAGWVKGRIRTRVVHCRALAANRWLLGCAVEGDLAAGPSDDEEERAG